jgi:predicted branched-subunit amino acid permease
LALFDESFVCFSLLGCLVATALVSVANAGLDLSLVASQVVMVAREMNRRGREREYSLSFFFGYVR